MSVLEKNSIDYIYVEDNHIIMGISDHLTCLLYTSPSPRD